MSRVYVGADGLAKCLPNLWPQFSELERFAHTGDPWSGLFAAQRSLIKRGLSYGPPDRELPLAVMNARVEVPKWSALTAPELALLVGVVYLEKPEVGYMDGVVCVRLRPPPGVRAAGRVLELQAEGA